MRLDGAGATIAASRQASHLSVLARFLALWGTAVHGRALVLAPLVDDLATVARRPVAERRAPAERIRHLESELTAVRDADRRQRLTRRGRQRTPLQRFRRARSRARGEGGTNR